MGGAEGVGTAERAGVEASDGEAEPGRPGDRQRRTRRVGAAVVALVVVVAALAGVVVVVRVGGRGDEAGEGRYGARLVTPRERAEAGDYVALGDSFSSGEGAGAYEDGTDVEGNRCHRSAGAYPARLAERFDFRGDVRVVTCSGAHANDLLVEERHGEPPQLDAVTPATSLVTVGIGGNDADWSAVVLRCWWSDAEGCTAGDEDDHGRIAEAADLAAQVYRRARAEVGDGARVVAVGYPRLFPVEPTDDFMSRHPACLAVSLVAPVCLTRTISPAEQRYMNGLAGDLNDRLAAEAEAVGVEFVDLTDAFDGHELTTGDAWVRSLVLDWPDCPPVTWDCVASATQPESLHPDADGQRRLAEVVARHVERPWG